jgi:transposase
MDRLIFSDAQWAKMEALCLGKPSDPGRSGKDNRLFAEAVLWIPGTGSPWRDLNRPGLSATVIRLLLWDGSQCLKRAWH